MCALNEQSHANHSFQLYILIVAVRYHVHNLLRAVYCSSTAVLLHVCIASTDANHSFQLYILLWLYSYHVQSAAVACCGIQQCAAACALLKCRAMPNHSFQRASDCSCTVITIQSAACSSTTAVRWHHAFHERADHANHSFQLAHLDCGCTVIMYHNLLRAVVLQQCVAATALLSKQSYANHSFQYVHL
jgi:hypothetical protein